MDLFLDRHNPSENGFENRTHTGATDGYTQVFCADAFDAITSLKNASVDLIVTSPPYNIGKEYEQDKRLSLKEYLEAFEPLVDVVHEKLKTSGSVCWQVGHYVEKGEIFPLDMYFYNLFRNRGFKLRNRIIWHFNFGLHATNRLSGRYETILWFTKSDEYKFNLDDIRVPQIYPGKKHSKSKGDRAGLPSGNPIGKNPSDFWSFSPSEAFFMNPVWEIPNVKSNHPEKTNHPCQFPIEIAERCVLAFTDPGDIVLDPFVGTGTTVIAAEKHKRFGYGIEKDSGYIDVARSRLEAFRNGDLKMRQSGKPPASPSTKSTVAKVPSAWLGNDG